MVCNEFTQVFLEKVPEKVLLKVFSYAKGWFKLFLLHREVVRSSSNKLKFKENTREVFRIQLNI